jgi:hypothetical protein
MAERMLVFGGHTGTATNDLWELDIGSGEWELKVSANVGNTRLAPDWRTVRCACATVSTCGTVAQRSDGLSGRAGTIATIAGACRVSALRAHVSQLGGARWPSSGVRGRAIVPVIRQGVPRGSPNLAISVPRDCGYLHAGLYGEFETVWM